VAVGFGWEDPVILVDNFMKKIRVLGLLSEISIKILDY
jgi:hypothetical protein